MKLLAATAVMLSLLAPTTFAAENASITVMRIGTQPSVQAPEANFTGAARVDSRFKMSAPGRVGGGIVTFDAGARTAWHTHPLGQTLIVTAGAGLVREWDGPIQEIKPGDIVSIAPGVKHWHGASIATGMTHIAIAEALDGTAVSWMEKVSDEQYLQ